MSDAYWILTKNEILNKVGKELGNLNAIQKNVIQKVHKQLPEEILATTPKISRGENYKGLPYLVLDYPRLFTKNNIFAIRSMFWWGRNLSTTLHLTGKWQKHFTESILNKSEFIIENNFLIATGNDEWIHDVEDDNYEPVNDCSLNKFEEILLNRPFLKLALSAPVHRLNEGVDIWSGQFEKMIELILSQG